jgi:hypothetical protein
MKLSDAIDGLREAAKIAVIKLNEQNLNNDDVISLAKALMGNSSVTTLDLSHNLVGGEGVKHLSLAIRIDNSITFIDLSNNLIGYDGIEYLSLGLEKNTSITHIDLSFNMIGLSQCFRDKSKLVELFEKSLGLKYLNLSYNHIGTEGAKILAKSLAKNQTIYYIDLSNNSIEFEAIEILANLFRLNENSSLKYIKLHDNLITTEEARLLAKQLDKCNNITCIYTIAEEIEGFNCDFKNLGQFEISKRVLDLSRNNIYDLPQKIPSQENDNIKLEWDDFLDFDQYQDSLENSRNSFENYIQQKELLIKPNRISSKNQKQERKSRKVWQELSKIFERDDEGGFTNDLFFTEKTEGNARLTIAKKIKERQSIKFMGDKTQDEQLENWEEIFFRTKSIYPNREHLNDYQDYKEEEYNFIGQVLKNNTDQHS